MLKPDLIVVWSGGNPPKQVGKLERAGIAVFYSNPRRLADIPGNMVRLGMLTGHEDQARKVAGQWNGRLDRLKRRYRNRAGLRVFYQVSDVPLFTLNGKQIVSEVIDLCGGKNVFADIPVLAPHVSTEAVLGANPEVIVSTQGDGNGKRNCLAGDVTKCCGRPLPQSFPYESGLAGPSRSPDDRGGRDDVSPAG